MSYPYLTDLRAPAESEGEAMTLQVVHGVDDDVRARVVGVSVLGDMKGTHSEVTSHKRTGQFWIWVCLDHKPTNITILTMASDPCAPRDVGHLMSLTETLRIIRPSPVFSPLQNMDKAA